jgi:hypothetical protein
VHNGDDVLAKLRLFYQVGMGQRWGALGGNSCGQLWVHNGYDVLATLRLYHQVGMAQNGGGYQLL